MPSAVPPTAETIDIPQIFTTLADRTPPEASVTMAGQNVRLVAFQGAGGWHQHVGATETVIVWSGVFDVEYRDSTVRLSAGQCTVIDCGREHRGVSEDGAQVMLLRSAS
jgi:mannose-6-phosphate isomerase-like protein (cupin superfamily)